MNTDKIRQRGERRIAKRDGDRRTNLDMEAAIYSLMEIHRAPVIRALREATAEIERLEVENRELWQMRETLRNGALEVARKAEPTSRAIAAGSLLRRTAIMVAVVLIASGMVSAATLEHDGPCPVPKPLTCEQLKDRIAQRCGSHADSPCRTDCATKGDIDRLVRSNKSFADARVAAVPLPCKPEPCWPIPVDTAVQPKPMGFWSLGPTAGYVKGRFVGLAAAYTFANPRAPQIVGAVTRNFLHDTGIWYTPPEQPDPWVTVPGETVWGVGVTLLWRLP